MGNTTGRKRWVCPECGKGALAPSRLRKIDVRRYCLPCSKSTGLLVEREAPALAKQRAAAAAQRAEKAKRERARAAARRQSKKETDEARWTMGGFDLRTEADALWKLYRKRDPQLPERRPSIELRTARGRGGSGTAYGVDGGYGLYNSGLITISPTNDPVRSFTIVVHELAHFAVKPERGNSHSREFYYAMRDVIEMRRGIRVSFHEVKKWGYSVDAIIERQLSPVTLT